jgi:hypothetical protein
MDSLEAIHHSQDIFKISGCLAPTPTFWISQLSFYIKHLIFKFESYWYLVLKVALKRVVSS